VVLSADGGFEYRYLACAVAANPAVTGWSPGNNASDPQNRDLSASTPFRIMPDMLPLWLTSTRPIVGSTVSITANWIPSGSPLGAILLGWTQYLPGIELTPMGMPDCFQYASGDSISIFVPVGGSGTYAFSLPNAPSFVGAHVYTQGVTFLSGVNPTGAISSNGIDLQIGRM